MREAGAQVHLVFEFDVDLVVVEVRVREKPVQSAADVVKVLLRVGRDGHPVEVVRVHDRSCVVEVVDHVVDGAAVGRALVRCADEDELLVASHFGARLACADPKELDHEQVQLKDELADVLVLPHAFVYFSRKLTDLDHISWFVPDELLEVLLHSKGSVHLGDVFHAPAPQVACLGARTVPAATHELLLAAWRLLLVLGACGLCCFSRLLLLRCLHFLLS